MTYRKKKHNHLHTASTSINTHKDTTPSYKYLQGGIALLSLIPIFIYFQNISQYALNIPWYDDYDAILGYLIKWQDLSIKDKIAALFQQHNEHRILPSRLVFIAYYYLTGKINFTGIIYIGNLQLIVIWLLISYFAYRLMFSLFGFISMLAAMVIFDLSNFNNSHFAMAGVSNFGVILFFLLSIYLYSKNGKIWSLFGLLIQFLCIFSSGSGILASVAIVVFNLLNRESQKTLLSLIATVCFTALYYYHYTVIPNDFTGKTPGDMLLFFFKLTGAHWGIQNRVLIGSILCIILGITLYAAAKKPLKTDKKYAFTLSLSLFLIASIASIAVFRSGAKEGIEVYSYSSRYLILPHLLSFTCVFFVLQAFPNNAVKWSVIPLAIILFLNASSNNYRYGLAEIQNMNEQLLTRPFCYIRSATQQAESIEKEACRRQIYCRE